MLVQAEEESVTLDKDVVYGKTGGVELKLDLSHPASRGRSVSVPGVHSRRRMVDGEQVDV